MSVAFFAGFILFKAGVIETVCQTIFAGRAFTIIQYRPAFGARFVNFVNVWIENSHVLGIPFALVVFGPCSDFIV